VATHVLLLRRARPGRPRPTSSPACPARISPPLCRPARRQPCPSPVGRLPSPGRRRPAGRRPAVRLRAHPHVPGPRFHVKPPPTVPASRERAARLWPADPAPAPRLLAPSPPPVDWPRRARGPVAPAAIQDRSTPRAIHHQQARQAAGTLLAIPGRPRKPSPLLSGPHRFLADPAASRPARLMGLRSAAPLSRRDRPYRPPYAPRPRSAPPARAGPAARQLPPAARPRP
jgi:hypothetical protein